MTTLTYTTDLSRPLRQMALSTVFMSDGRKAHRLLVHVLRDGHPVSLHGLRVGGTVRHVRAGTTIPLHGTVSEHTASVVLPREVYQTPGAIEIYLTLIDQDVCSCILAATACVLPASTDRWLDASHDQFSLHEMQEKLEALEARLSQMSAGTNLPSASQLVSSEPLTSWRFSLLSTTAGRGSVSLLEATPSFDDCTWTRVTVPHDWSIGLDFNASSLATYEGGYLDGGDAWYRTTVTLQIQIGRRYLLSFDGVYMESTVYINGYEAHHNLYGYQPFLVDATDFLQSGENVIAVFVRNPQPSSRWYSGSGIFRPVHLLTFLDNQVRMEHIHVTTVDGADGRPNGETDVTLDVSNHSGHELSCIVTANFFSPQGEKVASTEKELLLSPAEGQRISLHATVAMPTLWSLGQGTLYSAQIVVKTDSGIQRSPKITYGYRSIRFDKDTGFFFNGVHTKLKGVCVHHDGGCIGAAENRSAIERQVDLLLQMGCNAIRLAHNPFGAIYLDVCQQKGILLIEELFDGWSNSKKAKDFGRYFSQHYENVITSTIQRDWNNPAIIMWSIGNEVTTNLSGDGYTQEELASICQQLCDTVKQVDTTRPTTMGNNAPEGALKALMSIVDVVGINYQSNNQTYQIDKPIYGSETTSALSSRGIYQQDDNRMVYPSYDNKTVAWGSLAAQTVNDYLHDTRSCGHFVWTGFDYIGEPTEWNAYPAKSSYFGIVDTCGFPKDIYYMYQSMWTDTPMIHILPHWTHTADDTVEVWLYTNCARVELFLNGTSLGAKTLAERGSKNEFAYQVPFTEGTLVANGYDVDGVLVAQDIQYTAGSPFQLSLSSNLQTVQTASDDLCYITCDVLDKNGTLCPDADNVVTFSVSGGDLLGTDNGHGACVENYQSAQRSAFSGKCLCVVRPSSSYGSLIVTATSSGLTSASISIEKGKQTQRTPITRETFCDALHPPRRDLTRDIPATGIVLSDNTLSLRVGETHLLTATVTPSDATDVLQWFASTSGIVSISGGAITALRPGNVTITAKCGTQTATCTVTVEEATVAVTSISLTPSVLTLRVNETQTLTATILPDNATDKTISWSITPQGIASVSNGRVTALSTGEATITARCGEQSATCSLVVTDTTSTITALTLSQTQLAITSGSYASLTASIQPEDSDAEILWTSSHTAIADVTGNGSSAIVWGCATGECIITAHCGLLTASCSVSVTEDSTSLPVLYRLPGTQTFTAGEDHVIDTGLKLFESIDPKPKYTILFDINIGDNATPASNSDTIVLAHCMEESSPWPGFVLQIAGHDTPTLQVNLYGSVYRIMGKCIGKWIHAGVILNGAQWQGDAQTNPGSANSLIKETISSYTTAVDKTLLLGGYQSSDGTHGRFFDGKINQFIVYDGAMTEEELQKWVNVIL